MSEVSLYRGTSLSRKSPPPAGPYSYPVPMAMVFPGVVTFLGEEVPPQLPGGTGPHWDQVDLRIRLNLMHAQTHVFTSIGPLDP